MPKRPKLKIIIEKHPDGYVGYPIGLKGVIIGQGDTYESVLENTRSAIRFHVETFGAKVFDTDETVLEAFVAEAEVS